MSTQDVRDGVWAVVQRASRLKLGPVLLIAVALRLGAGLVFDASSTDTYEFGRLAENVTDGRGYSYFPTDGHEVLDLDDADRATRWLPSAYMPPLYTSVVILGAELGGPSHSVTVWVVRAVNLVLACGAVAILFLFTDRLLGSRQAATLAALGLAIYPAAVYAATQASAANLYIPLQILLLVLLLAAARHDSVAGGAAAGAVLGALCLVRAEAVPMIPVIAGWLWWAARTRGRAHRGRLVAAFLAVAALLPGAWLVRNSMTFDEPTTTIATTGGVNLWIGNHPGASGSQKAFDVPADLRRELDRLPPTEDYELRRERVFRRAALRNIADAPLDAFARDVKKLALLLGADVYDRRSLNPAYLAAWAALAGIGTLGLVEWWRTACRDRPTRVLVGGYMAFNILVPVVFFALARYKLPLEVTLLALAGGWLAGRCRHRPTPAMIRAGVPASDP